MGVPICIPVEVKLASEYSNLAMPKSRILGLRKFNIEDDNWNEAMQLIDEAIQIVSSKQYFAFYIREAPDKPFTLVQLNFSTF